MEAGSGAPLCSNIGTNCGSTWVSSKRDRADHRDEQHGRVDQRRGDGGGQRPLPVQQIGDPRQGRPQIAAGLAGPHQADMHRRETAGIARHRHRQRAAVAHRVAQPGDRRPDPRRARSPACSAAPGPDPGRRSAWSPVRGSGRRHPACAARAGRPGRSAAARSSATPCPPVRRAPASCPGAAAGRSPRPRSRPPSRPARRSPPAPIAV